MPFRIEFSDVALIQFRALQPLNIIATRKLIGSFPHDRWLMGRRVSNPTSPGAELMELRNGPIRLQYELNRAEQAITIVAILTVE